MVAATPGRTMPLIVERGRVLDRRQRNLKFRAMYLSGFLWVRRIQQHRCHCRTHFKTEFKGVYDIPRRTDGPTVIFVILALAIPAFSSPIDFNSFIAVGNSPLKSVLTPNGAELYVTNFAGNSVSVI